MFIVTNCEIDAKRGGTELIGKSANPRGPNELRFLRVEEKIRSFRIEALDDALRRAEADALIRKHKLPLDRQDRYFASLAVACELLDMARERMRNVVLFIPEMHDVETAIAQALDLKKRYEVEPVLFLYPVNSGGVVGTNSLQQAFQDLIMSATALSRVLRLTQYYRELVLESRRAQLYAKASEEHPGDAPLRNELYATLLDKDCQAKVSLLAQGSGAYLLQQVLQEPLYSEKLQSFDNVILSSPDVASRGHEEWIDEIECRGRIYIAINENDGALRISRQQARSERLGEDTTFFASQRAVYVNFTGVHEVGQAHDLPSAVAGDPDALRFFHRALAGRRAELGLTFSPSGQLGRLTFTTLHGTDFARAGDTRRLAAHRTCFFGFTYGEAQNIFLMEKLREILSDPEFGVELIAPLSGRTDVDLLQDIDNQLHAAHFGIVDISSLSPNVYIEAGVLIGLGKPVIVIRDEKKNAPLPFNIGSQFTISYSVTLGETPVFERLEKELRDGVEAILKSYPSVKRAPKWEGEGEVKG